MTVTVLAENTARSPGLRAEHGLSLHIETGEHRILFDMGQSDAFAENARALGIALDRVELAVLSHGHYDHGGGLEVFLRENATAPVYVNQHAFRPHFHGPQKYIGLDPALAGNPRLIPVARAMPLAPGIVLDPAPDIVSGADSDLQMEQRGLLLPDDFRHEQYLCIREEGKLYLFSGCAHRGVVNIARHFAPDVLIGGFHFKDLSPADPQLPAAARALKALGCRCLTCHCTGQAQFDAMAPILGTQLTNLSTGDRITL